MSIVCEASKAPGLVSSFQSDTPHAGGRPYFRPLATEAEGPPPRAGLNLWFCWFKALRALLVILEILECWK